VVVPRVPMSSEEVEVVSRWCRGTWFPRCSRKTSASSNREQEGEPSRTGEVCRLTAGLADGVSSGPLARRASCLERLRMTSDFIEMGRAEPCNL